MRAALDESQEAFARRFGCDQSTVSNWEVHGPGRRGTTLYALEQLRKELVAKKLLVAEQAS